MSRIIVTLVLFGLVLFTLGHQSRFYHGFHPYGDYHLGQHFSYPINYPISYPNGYTICHSFGDHFDHDCDHYHDGHDYRTPSISDAINRIKRKYSIAKSALQKFCMQNTQITSKVLYGTDAYIIIYQIPNANNLNITVKAINGLVITEVKQQGDFKGFKDIRILPEMLDLKKSFWSIEQSNLKILLPYKSSLATESSVLVCEPDDSEVNIPGNFVSMFQLRSSFTK